MSVDYSDLGIRIKRRREELKMSQAELASRAELSTQHISNVENARSKIGLDKLVTISNVLECSVDELLCGSIRTGSRSVYNDEIAGIIEDFSDTEMRILPEFLRNYNYIYKLLKQDVDESREE
ncbi:MAG: helix-turn-helix transcriptional regulator [Lachnospiraceae bacterium]|nr:helix-turn-helix transcriptional regulator [Lachnospiraceae bacterium]MDE7285963.1 helix-turn-helix transcriptional regulator [Lachnospiraceae bacterium]